MLSQSLEENHEFLTGKKPRLPKSQGGEIIANGGSQKDPIGKDSANSALRLSKISHSNLINGGADSIAISKDLDISMELVKIKDYRRIAKTYVIAFEKDPFVNYILNTEPELSIDCKKGKRKRDLMMAYFECDALECFFLGGLMIALKDKNLESDLVRNGVKTKNFPYLGAINWIKLDYDSNRSEYDYVDYSGFLDGFRPSFFKLSIFSSFAKCRQKLKNSVHVLTEERNKVLNRSNVRSPNYSVWYLSNVGILPSMRGKGLAKILINHSLSNYIEKSPNSWAYLESSNPENKEFYLKLGFEHVSTYAVNDKEINTPEELTCLDGMIKRLKHCFDVESVEILSSLIVL